MSKQPKVPVCNFCGSGRFVTRRTEYLYSYGEEYLIVSNMPVEVCLDCGMIYYAASALKEVERRFFAIQKQVEKPERYLQVPTMMVA
ncbi:MAG: type II toxin-antitoxin system MqsA family antitoxin [Chloroflexota bacterium]|nr:type II toxin-antitoxin system MqsA family antitoxin [Chloroflexota bacterium]